MTEKLNINHLNAAARPGGSSTLSSVTRLQPAAGAHASVAPAKYLKGTTPTYIFEDRFVDGKSVLTVMLDSKSSVGNRMESAINDAIDEGHTLLSKIPRIEVTYVGAGWEPRFRCLTLPHRAYDAHIRAGTVDGTPTTQYAPYIAARDADPSDALAMAEMSVGTLAFGGWDSSRRARQGRFPSLMVGEIIGVLANQDSVEPRPARHSGARVDPLAMGFKMDASDLKKILEPQKHEYSSALKSSAQLKVSQLGLGAIPPTADGLAGIATQDILRSHVLSFALARRMRFGKGPEGDAAIRVLILAVLINAMARSDSELYLRANCHLTEASESVVRLDGRHGKAIELNPITVSQADALLEEAYAAASKHGIAWHGTSLEVLGNPIILGAAEDSEN